MDKKKIFISYSWDSNEHKSWVRSLSDRLIMDGLDVVLDQYDLRLGDDIHHFMEAGASESSHIIVVCTPSYVSKANSRKSGVGKETSLITSDFYDRHINGKRYLPILRQKNEDTALPKYIANLNYLNFLDDMKFNESYECLIREIYGNPILEKPKKGAKPIFTSPITKNEVNSRVYESVELPSVDKYYKSLIGFIHRLSGLKNRKKAVFQNSTFIAPKNVNLDRKLTNEAIFKLSSYAQTVNPDYIVGVNRGGTMIGAHISLGLGIPSKRFFRCFVDRDGLDEVSERKLVNLKGRVLVLDDICRSGKTLDAAKKLILDRNNGLDGVYTATLISIAKNENMPTYEGLDFSSFLTDNSKVILPWASNRHVSDSGTKEYRDIKRVSIDEIARSVSNELYRPNKVD